MSIWHHYTLNSFNKEVYKKDLLFDDLIEEIDVDDEQFWTYKFNQFKCLFLSDEIGKLPVVMKNPLEEGNAFEKLTIGNKIYYKLVEMEQTPFKKQKTMMPYEFFDEFSNIEHTNKFHYGLYKALNLAGYYTKINARVASESEFSKNSVTKTLKYLTNQTRVITPASFPALLRGLLTTRVLNITEPKMFEHFDTFLEIVGDRDTHFENPKLESRGYHTYNNYDITRLSVLLTYNNLDYYKDKHQEDKFFDNIFRHHIQTRYIPFMFKGKIKRIEKTEMNDENYDKLLEWLRNFYYYDENWLKHLHGYSVDLSRMKWGVRYRESFEEIIKFIDFISKDENTFLNRIDELIRCHTAYERMVNGNSVGIYESIAPRKVEKIKDFEPLIPEIIDFSELKQSQNEEIGLVADNHSSAKISPLEFIKSKSIKGEMCIDNFLSSYTEDDLNKLLKNSDIFMPRNNLIVVLE